MKWLLGFFLCLNIFVFVLAYFSQDKTPGYAPLAELPESFESIELLSATATDAGGNCTNLGPIEQDIVLDRFVKILDKQQVVYQVISEPNRMIAAYRVVISPADNNEINVLKDRLNAVGIDEVYEKTTEAGGIYISLGVFTYEKTARDFAANLIGTGFAAEYKSELLEYPPRYWLNLRKALDQRIIKSLNDYIGSNKLRQNSATCI